MLSLNRATIIGHVTRDPEVRTTPNGQNVCSFGVATNLRWTDQAGQKQDRTEFHNVVAWRKLADIVGQYVKKGSRIYIEGRLQTRDWQDQQGQKRYRTEIVAENVIMLDRKTGGSAESASPNQLGGPVAPDAPASSEPNAAPAPTPTDDEEVRLEDVPF